MTRLRPLRLLALLTLLALAAASPALARVDVTVDADSLNGLIRAMAPEKVDVPLSAGRSVTLLLQDMKVTGFDPGAGANGGVTTSLRLKVPELGLDLPVEPRLVLEITGAPNGPRSCVLRFQQVLLNLPLAGAVDVASLLPPLPVMPDTAWIVHSARGDVRVKPTLVEAKTGAKAIRLGFDLQLAPVEGR